MALQVAPEEFPFVDRSKIEPRIYQVNLFRSAQKQNTLVVLPTGLGKTVVALMLAGRAIAEGRASGSKRGAAVVMLAPTKPLVEQHAAFFRENLLKARAPPEPGEQAEKDSITVADMTGEVPPETRELLWSTCEVVVATPQVVRNDLAASRVSLSGVRLLVLDEAHRATGDYAYVPLAARYRQDAGPKGRLLGLTASPGGNARDILAICETLGIVQIDVRTEEDADVAPYVHVTGVNWIDVELPGDFKVIASKLRRVFDREARKLQDAGVVRKTGYVTAGDIIRAREIINASLARLPPKERGPWWGLTSAQAKAMKVNHALEYIETQGLEVFVSYMDRILAEASQKGGSAAARSLVKDADFTEAYGLARASTAVHPKVEYVAKLVARSLAANPEGRIIVFAHFRETGEVLMRRLDAVEGVHAVRFVGQATRGEDVGLTQKEQVKVIEDFEAGKFNVLVATSVAEEGLDIPQVDHVIFYEPVPSEIRTIQRRGRTGRRREGQVEVLVARKTRDEAYRRAADARENTMRDELKRLRVNMRLPIEVLDSPQEAEIKHRLEDFAGKGKPGARSEPVLASGAGPAEPAPEVATGPELQADDRELKSPVHDRLRDLGVRVVPGRLTVGDFAVPPRIGVERKTVKDFAASITDGRLFTQARALTERYERAVVIIEGSDDAGFGGVAPEAFHGAVTALLVDLQVSVVRTRDALGTAQVLASLARRGPAANEGGPHAAARPHKTGLSLAERQRFVLEGLPGVSTALASRLLASFGSIRALTQASIEELAVVPGVGRKTAEQIYDVLRGAYPADSSA